MNEIHIVDTTLRDGQLSLWALGMRTGAMLAIAEQMDQCGFESMEFFGFAGYIKFVREHKENPWDWMGIGAKKFRRTRLRYHGGLATGFEKIPRSVRLLMIERVVAHGITLTRSSDPWNDYEASAVEIDALKKLGMDVVINIIYSVSPRHTDAYYAQKAREAAAIKPYRICFKDVAGLLTPERTRTLFPLIKKNIGDITARVSCALQQRHGAVQLCGSDQARCQYVAHGYSAARQRFIPAVDLQCGIECPGAWVISRWSTWPRSSQLKSISPTSPNGKAIRWARRENTITRNICTRYPAA